MARRMNYGPRFGTNIVGGPTGYIHTWPDKPKKMTRKVISGGAAARAKKKMEKEANTDTSYLDAQLRMVERIDQIIESLNFGMEEINNTASMGTEKETLIRRSVIVDVLRQLKGAKTIFGRSLSIRARRKSK